MKHATRIIGGQRYRAARPGRWLSEDGRFGVFLMMTNERDIRQWEMHRVERGVPSGMILCAPTFGEIVEAATQRRGTDG